MGNQKIFLVFAVLLTSYKLGCNHESLYVASYSVIV